MEVKKGQSIPQKLRKRAEVAARTAGYFFDASNGMYNFLPKPQEERYRLSFGVSWYLLRFLSLELSLKALRPLTRGEDFENKHPLNELFDELGKEGQEMILIFSGLKRQETVNFLRKHANAVVDLRYFEKNGEVTKTETQILNALNMASISLLYKFDMNVPIPAVVEEETGKYFISSFLTMKK